VSEKRREEIEKNRQKIKKGGDFLGGKKGRRKKIPGG